MYQNEMMGGNNGYNEYTGVKTPNFYSAITEPINFDVIEKLKFTSEEIYFLKNFMYTYGQVTTARAQKLCGLSVNDARKLKYMFDICTGRISINSSEDLSKHYRRMNGSIHRIGIQDLAISRVRKIPRKAVIAGIPSGPFNVYNSNQNKRNPIVYNVKDVTSANIVITTDIRPVLKYNAERGIDGVININNVNSDGTVDVAVNKQYIRMCNRFIVVASLRRPEFHHGMIDIICKEGTRVYIYGQTMGPGEIPSYKNGTQRVYDYGYSTKELTPKLMNTARSLYIMLGGVYSNYTKGNSDFFTLNKVQEKPAEESIEVE